MNLHNKPVPVFSSSFSPVNAQRLTETNKVIFLTELSLLLIWIELVIIIYKISGTSPKQNMVTQHFQ